MTEEHLTETESFVMNTYARIPLAFESGRGMTLVDTNGKEYTDFLGGLAVASLGHSHPSLVEVIQQQAATLLHTSNLYHIPNQSKLARYLSDIAFPGKTFFSNSGAEANEAAVKLARRYHAKVKGKPRPGILCFERSFHGRTLAMITATGQKKYQDGFEPLPGGFSHVPYNDIDAVRAALNSDPSIGAVIIELIQAEGGIHVAEREFISQLREVTKEKDVVLIIDEVQTGMGRTGKLFAFQDYDIQPDIMTLAKGLGGGIPIGATHAIAEIAEGFEPGSHASTFGGNPFATAVAIAVIKAILNDQIVERVVTSGETILERLTNERRPMITDIRGKGLLIGIELDRPAAPFVSKMRDEGYLIGTAGENILRLTPPLIVSRSQCGKMLDVLFKVLS